MQLLGNYNSTLVSLLYQQLLNQLQNNISVGEYGAGQFFDTASVQVLQAQGQDFTNITIPASGSIAYAEDFNVPYNTLLARYNAITNEITSLQNSINNLLSLASKEGSLIDQLISTAEGGTWAALQPNLTTANRVVWNFAGGTGVTSNTYPSGKYKTDPVNSVVYPYSLSSVSYVLNESLAGNGQIIQGLGSPATSTIATVSDLQWNYTPASDLTEFEIIYGDDQTWTYLQILEPNPLVTYGPPNINVVLPAGGSSTGLFTASGSFPGGNLPIYVSTFFYPRTTVVSVINATSNQNVVLSNYNVVSDTVNVYTSKTSYVNNTDYSVSNNILTVIGAGALVGANFSIIFTEYYPAYRCSVDQMTWGPTIMLDPLRPYPDDTINFIPLQVQNGNFPITDELGVSTGLYLQMVGVPNQEMTLVVNNSGGTSYGEISQLQVSLQQPSYVSGLNLTPFSSLPVYITNITALGFANGSVTNVLDIPVLLNTSTVIRFTRQLVSSFTITFSQPSYSVEEYIFEAPDSLRRSTLASLQSSLPFSVQRPQPANPQRIEGVLYEFGIQDIVALDYGYTLPGVFSSGPYLVEGQPEVIRFDMSSINMPTNSSYLAYVAYNGNDEEIDQNEIPITAGSCIKYPSVVVADHVDFYIKFVLRQNLSVAEKFLLQVTTVGD